MLIYTQRNCKSLAIERHEKTLELMSSNSKSAFWRHHHDERLDQIQQTRGDMQGNDLADKAIGHIYSHARGARLVMRIDLQHGDPSVYAPQKRKDGHVSF